MVMTILAIIDGLGLLRPAVLQLSARFYFLRRASKAHMQDEVLRRVPKSLVHSNEAQGSDSLGNRVYTVL